MKSSIEEILEKIEELGWDYKIKDFISSLDLTPEQMDILVNHENDWVQLGLAENLNLTEKVMIKLASNEDWCIRNGIAQNPSITEKLIILLVSNEDYVIRDIVFKKLKKLNSLSSEDLEKSYDLIMKSKYTGRVNLKFTFDYIADEFPGLYKLAKIYKVIILKGKRDLK